MSKFYGTFKMVTSAETVYADKVKELVSLAPESTITAVYEFNRTTGKYRPNKSTMRWLCQQRGQELPQEPQEAPNENVKAFREMCSLMNEMDYSEEDRKATISGFMGRLPLKK